MTKKIAFVIADGFEDREFSTPKAMLTEAGYAIEVIGVGRGVLCGIEGTEVSVDHAIGETDMDDYAALVVPGGESPSHLVAEPAVVELVRAVGERGLPVAAMCHGPSLLAAAGLVQGRTVTANASIHHELGEAGAQIVEREVVVDGNLITSRDPADLPAFCNALLQALLEGDRDASGPTGA